jgi:fructokinase
MIVVTGEALFDLIPTATGDLGVHPGGGPFNTARWLGRLGADVAFLESIAADPLGQRLRDELVAAGVALDLVVATELPTTLALVQLDAAGAAQYTFYPETSMADVWPEQVDALLPSVDLDALYLGSIGLVLEPAASAGLRAVELARERGALVMVDPNVRASLIADRSVYLTRLEAVLAQTHVLKLSVEDLEWLAPVLTPDGSIEEIAPIAVDVVDTIGAGDAFSAGFLARWLGSGKGFGSPRTKTLPASGADVAAVVEAATFAARVAAVACSVPGGTPPADLAERLQAAG